MKKEILQFEIIKEKGIHSIGFQIKCADERDMASIALGIIKCLKDLDRNTKTIQTLARMKQIDYLNRFFQGLNKMISIVENRDEEDIHCGDHTAVVTKINLS